MTVRRLLLSLSLAVSLAAAAAPAWAQQDAAESQRRLQEIREERRRLRQELETVRSRVHDVNAEIANIRAQAAQSAALLQELDAQIAAKQAEVAATTRELLLSQDRLAERRALLQRRMRDVYKRGPLQTAQVLLMAESFSDLLNRYKYLYLVTRRDRLLVRDVDRLRQQLAARDQALKAALSDIEYLQVEHRAEFDALRSLEGVQRQTLTSLRSRESTAQRRATELEQDENRLVAVLANLDRRRVDAERTEARRTPAPAPSGGSAPAAPTRTADRGPEAPTLTTADAGALAWPVQGRLVYRFGRETQPNGTTIRWNGVGIAAAAGSPVRVVESGTVVMASSFEGYGPTVVVSHGGGYYSLYLYLRDMSVREGATVTKGQVIGTVGGEQTPEGPHVEFQIRAQGGRAVDPLTWLRRGGGGG